MTWPGRERMISAVIGPLPPAAIFSTRTPHDPVRALLDVTVGVFVIGIIVDRIQRAFDTLDTRKLTVLRE